MSDRKRPRNGDAYKFMPTYYQVVSDQGGDYRDQPNGSSCAMPARRGET